MTPVQSTTANAAAGTSISATLTGVTANNLLVFAVGYNDVSAANVAPTAPSGWSAAINPASRAGSAGQEPSVGASIFYLARSAGGSVTVTMNCPGGGANLYAQASLTEWPITLASPLDQTAGPGTNQAASTTGGSTPATGTLAQAAETVIAAMAIGAINGLSNAGITTPTGCTQLTVSQNTSTGCGAEVAYKDAGATTAQTITWGWTSDSSQRGSSQVVATFLQSGSGAVLAGAATVAAAIAAALTTAIKLAATAAAATSAAGVLTTAIQLAAGAIASITMSGTLPTGGAVLAGAAGVAAVGAAALNTGISLAGALTAVANESGALTGWATVVLTSPLTTGLGSIIDSHLWPTAVRLPQVGDTIYYDPTYITINPDSTATASNNNCAAVVQFNDGVALRVGTIVFTPYMVGELDVTATLAGGLTTSILLASAMVITSVASGSLGGSAAPLAGAATVLAAAAAALNTGIALVGSLLISLTAAGTLGAAAVLTGSALVGAVLVGALTTAIQAAAAAQAVSAATGDLTSLAPWAGSAVVVTSATGMLPRLQLSQKLAVSVQLASSDGLYWGRYPQGNRPPGPPPGS